VIFCVAFTEAMRLRSVFKLGMPRFPEVPSL
jgi:hypothetical protein